MIRFSWPQFCPNAPGAGVIWKEHELRKSREEILERWEKDKKEFEHKKSLEKLGEETRKAFEKSISDRTRFLD